MYQICLLIIIHSFHMRSVLQTKMFHFQVLTLLYGLGVIQNHLHAQNYLPEKDLSHSSLIFHYEHSGKQLVPG